MKKFLALVLALCMVLALCACGAEEAAVEETVVEEAAVEETAEEAAPAEEAEVVEEEAAAIDPLTITFNSSYAETETGGVLAGYFKDYLEEATDGAITVNISYSGTLFTADDELDACGDGAINMMIFGHTKHNSELPVLCSIPDFAPDSVQNAVDYFDYVLNDTDAGAAIEEEAADYGIRYLSVNAGGANYFLADFEFANLTELIAGSAAFGNMAPAKFETLGLTVVAVFPWDYYTAFDTGLMDASQMDGAAMYSMSLYEVAPYWMKDNTYAAGNFMTVNAEWFDSLTEAQQNAIQEACDATAAYSVEYNTEACATLDADLEANGVTLATMSDAEFDQWWSAIFDAAAADARTAAEENGNTEAVEAVLAAAATFTGYTL